MARQKKEVIRAVSENEASRFVDVADQSFLVSVLTSYVSVDNDGIVRQHERKPKLINGKWQPSLYVNVVGFVVAPDEPYLISIGKDNEEATNETNTETKER